MDSANMTVIRLGVIGTGVMGADHVETISKSVARAEVRRLIWRPIGARVSPKPTVKNCRVG